MKVEGRLLGKKKEISSRGKGDKRGQREVTMTKAHYIYV